jgi:hypothetical protein
MPKIGLRVLMSTAQSAHIIKKGQGKQHAHAETVFQALPNAILKALPRAGGTVLAC